MHVPIANYMLPAMQIVCHLVAPGTGPDFNVTNLVPAVGQTTPQPQPTPTPLPEGYVAHPDVGFAYKVYNESVNAMDARRRCIKEGAQLALIDSAKKWEYVKRQGHSQDYAHVGIIRRDDDKVWVAVSTGLPVSSLPWMSGYPRGTADCVQIRFGADGLENWPCGDNENYVCEIPILKNIAMSARAPDTLQHG